MFAASFSTARERMSLHLASVSFVLHAGVIAATSAKKAPASSGSYSIVFLVLIAAAAYFLLIRPQRNRVRRAQQTQQAVQLGDQVMLTSGILGRVTWLEGDRARVEIAPNTEIEVLRAAIGRTIPSAVSDDDIAVQHEDDAHYGDNPYEEPGTDGAPGAGGTDGTGGSAASATTEKGDLEEGT